MTHIPTSYAKDALRRPEGLFLPVIYQRGTWEFVPVKANLRDGIRVSDMRGFDLVFAIVDVKVDYYWIARALQKKCGEIPPNIIQALIELDEEQEHKKKG